MDAKKEQWVCIKFCARHGKNATETLGMVQQAFGQESMSRAQVFDWHAWFRAGRTSVDDDEHTGRPLICATPEIIAQVQRLVRTDQRRTIQDLADEVCIGYGTWRRMLTEELGMHRVASKFVPRILTPDQKQERVNICEELRQIVCGDAAFSSRVITADES